MRLSLVALLAPVLVVAGAGGWRSAAPVPVARTEVVAARLGDGEIAVVGGYLPSGANSARADAYSPQTNRWRRLPSLPVTVDHAAASSYRGSVYVAGGYGADRRPLRTLFVFRRRAWRSLPPMPEGRGAAAAAVAANTLYVIGGIGPSGLADRAFAFDLRRRRWSVIPSPTPREHLAAAAYGGRLYAVAGPRFRTCRSHAAAQAPQRLRAGSSPSAGRRPAARSAPYTRTTSRRAG